MKRPFILLAVCVGFCIINISPVAAQDLRYFQFSTMCGHKSWQDTSFIAATSDTALIDTLMAELKKPLSLRKFIAGKITHGHGGYNHNDTHYFKWHFIPGQWNLVEAAAEVCDGCPTDVDADTAYWIGNLGIYCPWNARPSKEVFDVVSVRSPGTIDDLRIYPDPASAFVTITLGNSQPEPIDVRIYDLSGKLVKFMGSQDDQDGEWAVRELEAGLYHVVVQGQQSGRIYSGRFIKR